MPGRHGKQRIKKKKSKRLPVTEMEKTLKDSIHGRKRTEKQILAPLVPPLHRPKLRKPTSATVIASLPMFSPPPAAPVINEGSHSPAQSAAADAHQASSAKKKKKEKK